MALVITLVGLGLAPRSIVDSRFADSFFHEVPLVDDDDAGFAVLDDMVRDFLILLGDAGFGVEDQHDDVAAGDRILGALDAEEFE